MTGITTHILDTSLGKPATGIGVSLEKREDDSWLLVAQSLTNADGRCDAVLFHPAAGGSWPAVLIWPDIMGLRPAFRDMGRRLPGQG